MKKFVVFVAAVLLAATVSIAATNPAAANFYAPGKIYVTPQIGFYSWGGSIPFGANVEYALDDKIGIAGTVMFQFWSGTYWKESNITISGEVNYHVNQFFKNLPLQKFDFYAGGGIGYNVYSITWNTGYENYTGYTAGSSGLALEIIAGARYAFSPKMAGSLRIVGSPIGWGSGIGTTIGVAFNL